MFAKLMAVANTQGLFYFNVCLFGKSVPHVSKKGPRSQYEIQRSNPVVLCNIVNYTTV